MIKIYYEHAKETGYCYCDGRFDGVVMIPNELFTKMVELPDVKEILDNY